MRQPVLPKVILLSLLLYRGLLRLGPPAFRRDYAAAALNDFRQCCRAAYQQQGAAGVLLLWPALIGETVPGLLAEYLGGPYPMLPTLRRSLIAVFWSGLLFLLAAIALGRIADPSAPFNAVGNAHAEVAISHAIMESGILLTLFVIVVGGLPIMFIAVKQAVPDGLRGVLKLFLLQPKQAFSLLGIAFLCAAGFLCFLLVTQTLFSPPPCTSTNGCVFAQSPLMLALSLAMICGLLTSIFFVILAIMTSLSLAVLRSEFKRSMLRFALIPIGLLVLTITTSTAATAIWLLRLWLDAPQFVASSSGFGNGQIIWVISILITMALSAVVSAAAFSNGLRASRRVA
ncbi:hypothetical protein KDA_40470 [Dictyobacter alpinus]|uniref:Uncharacterized protein n=1 Tax=Dictyobacter alpinus TaxID=2014873 RepID=A0A402BAY0_9CHLR|nr:hypothetical protein [Dictyobacter alpinus]GCE28563.1 hypothetical protein KDA_40470 [Dictyobacter alpinus]